MNTQSTVPAGAVVVGVDGSEGAAAALEWAVGHARLVHRPLVLAHGWEGLPLLVRGQTGMDPREVEAEVERAAEAVVAEAVRRVAGLAPEVEVVDVVVHEDPRSLLAGLAGTAALTVVGSRGRGTISTLLLGSVSSAVSRHGRGPVVVVRPGGPAPGEGRGVLAAVDGEPGSDPVVEAAFEQAALRSLGLTVLHCTYDARIVGGATPEALAQAEQEARAVIGQVTAGLQERFPEVAVTPLPVFGHVEDELLEAAHGADLVVIGHRDRHPLVSALLGSVSRSFLEQAHGAVMVVPERD